MFFLRKKAISAPLRTNVINLYRQCLKVIKVLEPNHQKIWYDYTKLKYEENKMLSEEKKIARVIQEAEEQIEWMKSIIDRKKNPP